MKDRLLEISSHIKSIQEIEIIQEFELSDSGLVSGKISVAINGYFVLFDVEIYPSYPFQFHEVETIRFINMELIIYNHVNSDGSICVHTAHHRDLKTKLSYDFDSLKKWVQKYYINKESDLSYEHIVVQPSKKLDVIGYYLFTEVSYAFIPGEIGTFKYTTLNAGEDRNGKKNATFLIREFKVSSRSTSTECKWNRYWLKTGIAQEGVFCFLKEPPVNHRRFIFENWQELENHVPIEFLNLLQRFIKESRIKRQNIKELPVLFGYKIPSGEVHWQCATIKLNNFPVYSEKLVDKKGNIDRLRNQLIDWNTTKNCSYTYFFGRGAFHPSFTHSNIIILGVGAIGSIVAHTLTRGGCRSLSIVDYDLKEPENVCRSEYKFISGVTLKVTDLAANLLQISPFIEVKRSDSLGDLLKRFSESDELLDTLRGDLNCFDYIIDCSADNDLLSTLETISPRGQIISVSITNHADSLIFGTGHDVYEWVKTMSETLKGNTTDLYEPTGCWSPTFKASYNDVNVLVQYAIKQFNNYLLQNKPIRKFYLSTNIDDGFTIKLHEF